MRIRKDKKLAQLGLSADAAVHACQLNQSPWDAPSATSSRHHHHDGLHHYNSSSSFRSPLFQVVRGHEDGVDTSLTGNGSLGDSLGAVDSVASMDRDESTVVVAEYEVGNGIGEKLRPCCNKTNGKGWQCQKPAKRGQSMCRHHLNQLTSYRHNHGKTTIAPPEKKKHPAVAPCSRRGRGRGTKKAAPPREENPYTFYYYAGFGPTWGRKRSGGGGANGPEIGGGRNVDAQDPIAFAESSDDDEDHNRVEEEGDDTSSESESDSDSSGGGKRVRRPVKERSLKSLM